MGDGAHHPREFWKAVDVVVETHRNLGVDVTVTTFGFETDAVDLWISTSEAERGKRRADDALREMLDVCDRFGATVTLTAQPPEDDPALPDAERLAKWYEKHGFVRVLGQSRGGIPMRRDPR